MAWIIIILAHIRTYVNRVVKLLGSWVQINHMDHSLDILTVLDNVAAIGGLKNTSHHQPYLPTSSLYLPTASRTHHYLPITHFPSLQPKN